MPAHALGKTMGAISPARKTAFDILTTLEQGHAHSDAMLRTNRVNEQSAADRNLITALVLGVLRWQTLLDARIQELLNKPNAKLDTEVRIALRLGAFQLLYLDRVPAHAAIDESVELTKQAGHSFAARMVNAVLRKLSAAGENRRARNEVEQERAAMEAHPAWLVERWSARYGDTATRALCMHNQEQAVPMFRMVHADAEQELSAAGATLEPGEVLSAARRAVHGDLAEALRTGRVRQQAEGSQLIGEIAAFDTQRLLDLRTILDVCAAPGGKTMILAERNPAARIVACEANEYRLEQLAERLKPLALQVECRHADATRLEYDAEFDRVLADVPCSGTGTLGRNPEIRHRLHAEDLPRQAERQRAILTAALRAARSGGQVVYATCSLEAEENEEVVAAVLKGRFDVRIVSLSERIAAMHAAGLVTDEGARRLRGCMTPEGYLRLLPGVLHTDGFFVALMEKLPAKLAEHLRSQAESGKVTAEQDA